MYRRASHADKLTGSSRKKFLWQQVRPQGKADCFAFALKQCLSHLKPLPFIAVLQPQV